jgi:uroporphyrinogen decarboxylase
MTPKERITTAFRNKKPDRIPVSPELWDVIPIKVSGRPFYEIGATSFGKIPLWNAQLDAYRYFNCEAWIPVEPLPSNRQKSMLDSKSYFVNPELIRTDNLYKTSKGFMKEVKHSVYDYDLWPIEKPVKNLFEDMPKLEEYYFDDPSRLDFSEILKAYEKTGDSGICEGIIGNTFFEFITQYKEGGAVQVLLDLNDYPDYFKPIRDRYIDYMAGIAEEIVKNINVDGIFINCGTSSLDTISPNLFTKWDLPLFERLGRVAKENNKIFHYHLHGMGRALLDDLVRAGVSLICPLEGPPRGDFDLAEVKKKFGDRLALKGNIDPFFPLRDGTIEDVERKAIECIKIAGKNGGFVLSSGDGVLKETPFENIFAMVEVGKKYGKY